MTATTAKRTDPGRVGQLRMTVETYYDTQDVRIRTDARISQYADFMALIAVAGQREAMRERDRGPGEYRAAIRKAKKEQAKEWAEAHEAAVVDLEGEKKHMRVNSLMAQQERILKARAQKLIDGMPIWEEWLKDVRGIGPCLAGGLISWISPKRARRVSSIWKYCGLAVTTTGYVCGVPLAPDAEGKVQEGTGCGKTLEPKEVPTIQERMKKGLGHTAPPCPDCGTPLTQLGERDRMRAGQKAGFNPTARRMAWLIGESFIKMPSEKAGYRRVYEEMRRRVEKRPCRKVHKDRVTGKVIPCFDAHKLAKAKRLTVKVFLCHYWMVSRAVQGLPLIDPYALGMLGADPADFIEPIRDVGEIDPGIREAWAHFGEHE